MTRILAIVAVAACSPSAGCSLFDALQGDGPAECPPDAPFCVPSDLQLKCSRPFDIGSVAGGGSVGSSFDLCGQDATGIGNLCGSANMNGGDAVLSFDLSTPGDYEICTFGPPGSSGSLMPGFCDDAGGASRGGICLDAPGCSFVTLDEGEHFIHWQLASPGQCGPIDVTVTALGPSGGEAGATCLNGLDDDDDGFQDCEDLACRVESNPECQAFTDPELCNGFDDGTALGFTDGMIDEAACLCVNDSGCDSIGFQLPYVCHQFGDPTQVGVCAPLCTDIDWCGPYGLRCDPMTLRCEL